MEIKKIHKWFIVFSFRVLAIYLAFYMIYAIFSIFGLFYYVNIFEATLAHNIMQIFYPEIEITKNTLTNLAVNGNYSNFAVTIDNICLGWFPITGFISMIIALPRISAKKKIYSILIGIPVLFAANILRIIIILFAAALLGIAGFNFFHLFIVKFDLLIVIIFLFIFVIKKVIGKKELLKSINSFSDKKE